MILTGATGGIGRLIARELARQDMQILLTSRSAGDLDSLAEELTQTGAKVETACADITHDGDRRNLPKRARAAFGQVDFLINNAGIEETVAFEKQDPDVISKTIDTNIKAPILLCREILPDLLERDFGGIVNVASVAGLLGMPYGAVYSGSKSALIQWGLSLQAEIAGSEVTVCNVCPGFVSEVGMFARKNSTPPKILNTVTPSQVAKGVIEGLISKKSEIIVNGGPTRTMMGLRALSPKAFLGLAKRIGLIRYLKSLDSS